MIMEIVPLGYSDKVIEVANNAGAKGVGLIRLGKKSFIVLNV